LAGDKVRGGFDKERESPGPNRAMKSTIKDVSQVVRLLFPRWALHPKLPKTNVSPLPQGRRGFVPVPVGCGPPRASGKVPPLRSKTGERPSESPPFQKGHHPQPWVRGGGFPVPTIPEKPTPCPQFFWRFPPTPPRPIAGNGLWFQNFELFSRPMSPPVVGKRQTSVPHASPGTCPRVLGRRPRGRQVPPRFSSCETKGKALNASWESAVFSGPLDLLRLCKDGTSFPGRQGPGWSGGPASQPAFFVFLGE